MALDGRWCDVCGGELLLRRRRETDLIGRPRLVTYLVCQFCGALTPTLACDMETMALTDLTTPPPAVSLSD